MHGDIFENATVNYIHVTLAVWPLCGKARNYESLAEPPHVGYARFAIFGTRWLGVYMCEGEVNHHWLETFNQYMMTSSNGNIFRVTGHLCGEFTGLRWIPRTKASDAELWCFLWCARLSKHSRGWSFETLSHPLWRHRNEIFCFNFHRIWFPRVQLISNQDWFKRPFGKSGVKNQSV